MVAFGVSGVDIPFAATELVKFLTILKIFWFIFM
jgi:hypothetical protein